MKTAILISGYMRSFERCLPTQIDQVYRHFPAADFFVSTVRDEDSHTAEILREKCPHARVEIEVLDCQPEIPIPVPPVAPDWTAGSGRLYGHEPYAISVHPQAILRQLWHLNRVWVFAESFGTTKGRTLSDYDLIIRCRPDNYIRSARIHPDPTGYSQFPWWGRFGGVNDRFAILRNANEQPAAHAYFTTFTRINELLAKGYPLHPERLVYASLVESDCVIDDTLRIEFSKLIWDRGPQHGQFRDPEITLIDLAHCALRS